MSSGLNGIAALLLVGLGLPAAAQPFNLRHDLNGPNSTASTAWCVELSDAGDLIVIGNSDWADSLFYSSVVSSMVVSPTGQVLSSSHVWYPSPATYPGWSNSSDERSDGGFVIGGNTLRTDSLGNLIRRAALFMLAPDGSVDSLLEVGPENQSWIGRQAKQPPVGGYVICGETSSVGNALQAFVIKTDAQGNEEWMQTYGGAWNDEMVSINPDPTGTLYFTGGIRRVSSGNPQFWVQCLNDTGAVVWEKIWGSTFSESNSNVTLAQNGDLLVAGGWAYSNFGLVRRYLARLDPADGSFIWQREYSALANDAALQVVKEVLPSMDLITVGSMAAPSNQNFGTLLRTTSTGDSLWMRHYQYHDSLVSNGRGILRDVVPTPDGGFVAVGSAFSVPGVYTQDVWVIKVDSIGCLEPGCQLITGMETQITNLRGALQVWPNPVAQGGSVQVRLNLPEGFTPQGQLRITVVSSDGRVVHEDHLPNPTGQLATGNLRPGLYHVHIHDATRWISGAKLLVE